MIERYAQNQCNTFQISASFSYLFTYAILACGRDYVKYSLANSCVIHNYGCLNVRLSHQKYDTPAVSR